MPLTDAEVRHLIITALTAPTARDKQTRVGASDLADPCDACLAHALAGRSIRTRIADRPFMKALVGTSMGMLIEHRLTAPEFREAISLSYPGRIVTEEHHHFGTLTEEYGEVGGSVDIGLPDEGHEIDLKKLTRAGIMLLRNALADPVTSRANALPLPEGYWERVPHSREKIAKELPRKTTLSERDYVGEIAHIAYILDKYEYQQHLYMHSGAYSHASLAFVAQDEAATGYFDHPLLDGYDPADGKAHDIFVVSFAYDATIAEALLERARVMLREMEAGAEPSEFTPHPLCFVHSVEARDEVAFEKAADDLGAALAVAA